MGIDIAGRLRQIISILGTVDTDVGIIEALLEDGGVIDQLIDDIKAKTDNLPVDPADASDIADAHALLATVAKQDIIDGIVDDIIALLEGGGTIDQLIDDIKAKTDNLPVDPADASDIATAHGLLATEAKQDIIDTNVDDIETDTNEIQQALADGGFTDLLIDAIKAKTDNLPVDPADASDIATAHALLATEAKQDIIDGIVDDIKGYLTDGGFTDLLIDAIKAKTDNLPVDPADASDIATAHGLLATEAKQDIIDQNVDDIEADTNELQTDWHDGGRLDLIIDALALEATVAALNNISTAQVNTEVDLGLTDIDLDHLIKVAHPTGDPVADSLMDLIMNKDGGQTFARATDSLEAIGEAVADISEGFAAFSSATLEKLDDVTGVIAPTVSGTATNPAFTYDNNTGTRATSAQGQYVDIEFPLPFAIVGFRHWTLFGTTFIIQIHNGVDWETWQTLPISGGAWSPWTWEDKWVLGKKIRLFSTVGPISYYEVEFYGYFLGFRA